MSPAAASRALTSAAPTPRLRASGADDQRSQQADRAVRFEADGADDSAADLGNPERHARRILQVFDRQRGLLQQAKHRLPIVRGARANHADFLRAAGLAGAQTLPRLQQFSVRYASTSFMRAKLAE